MARPLTVPPPLTLDALERRYRRSDDPVTRRHWQILWRLAGDTATAQAARVTGYPVNLVREIARCYQEDWPEALGDRRYTDPGAATGRAALAVGR